MKGQGISDSIAVAEPFHIIRLYCDSSGKSHFSDEKLSFQLLDFAPPAPPISVSEMIKIHEDAFIISSPAGWFGSWHPAPKRQMLFMLEGKLEVEVSDGDIRTFLPGSAILVEDTIGKGHISHVIGDDRCYMLVLPVAEY